MVVSAAGTGLAVAATGISLMSPSWCLLHACAIVSYCGVRGRHCARLHQSPVCVGRGGACTTRGQREVLGSDIDTERTKCSGRVAVYKHVAVSNAATETL